MEKLRNVYKGDVDHFVPFGPMPDNLINLKEGIEPPLVPNMVQPVQPTSTGSIPRATDKNEGIPQFSYQDYANQDDKENDYQNENNHELA